MAEVNTYDVYEITFSVLLVFTIYCFITSLIILNIYGNDIGIETMEYPQQKKVKDVCKRVDKLMEEVDIQNKRLDSHRDQDCCAICIGHNFCLSKQSVRIPIVCDYNESDLKSLPELWDSSSLIYLSKLKQLTEVMVIDLGMFCYSTLVDNPGMKGDQGTTIPDTMEGVIAAYNSSDPKWNVLRELINYFKSKDTEIQFQGVSVKI